MPDTRYTSDDKGFSTALNYFLIMFCFIGKKLAILEMMKSYKLVRISGIVFINWIQPLRDNVIKVTE